MAHFAVVSDGSVINVIVADSREIAEEITNTTCIEYDGTNPAGIGWTYDAETQTFSAPTQEPPIEEAPTE
jgi:hypothetical protein